MIRHKAVYRGGSGEIVEKKSRFIANIKSVETVEEAQVYIEEMKKKYWDARHNCSAFSVGTEQVTTRCSDDGEPSGTAGKPILEVISGSGIHNIVVVVTRYFGGTLLGTGGLVRAYTDATRAGIENSDIVEKIPGRRVDIAMVYRGGSGEIVEKKSRFIANIKSVETVEEAQVYIEEMKKKYWDARHNCSAFSVGTEQVTTRCSDDGEPSGTAGKPILEVISGSGIHNIVVVVTRYFGGTLLGTGGLVRAYTDATRAGIENSDIVEKIPGRRVDIAMDYTDLGKLQYLLAQNEVLTEDTEYTDKVIIHALFPESDKEMLKKKITEATSGRVMTQEGEEVYFGTVDGEVIVF